MIITEFDEFIDVCCDVSDMNELEIATVLRDDLQAEGHLITEDPPQRVGNPGNGTIFRFRKME